MATTPTNIQLRRQDGVTSANDQWESVAVGSGGRLVFNHNGQGLVIPLSAEYTLFDFPPSTAVTVGSTDQSMITLGTGTEVVTHLGPGAQITTQATPTDNDNAMLISASATLFHAILTAKVRPRFRTTINLPKITKLVCGAGLDENITSPVSNATAGDGAGFYFDPAAEVTTGTAAANWALSQKVAGADTWIDSGVAVAANTDYLLEVKYDSNLKPNYYINGTWVGIGVAGTANAVLGAVIGVQINGTTEPDATALLQRSLIVRSALICRS